MKRMIACVLADSPASYLSFAKARRNVVRNADLSAPLERNILTEATNPSTAWSWDY